MRPEIELLFCCARTSTDAATAANIQTLLQKDLDWAYLLQKATQHGVLSLFYANLQKTHRNLIPQDIFRQLHSLFQIQTARKLFLTKELFQILDFLAINNISVIPFKGPILAKLTCDNLALREFSDLDILVRQADFPKAKELLNQQGYRHKESSEHEALCSAAQMLRDDGKVNIDLHYNIQPRDFLLPIDTETFWQRLQPLSIAGQTVSTFGPEDTLLVAYVHASKENWLFLKRLVDIAELIRVYPDLNWEEFIARLAHLGNEKGFLFTLVLAKTYLGISLPEVAKQKLTDFPDLEVLARQHYKIIFGKGKGDNKALPFGGISINMMADLSNFWSRLRYGLSLALKVNEKDRESLALPKFLFFLYYPIRFIRLMKTSKIFEK